VRTSENVCPFCSSGVDFTGVQPPKVLQRRLGRAAIMTFGAMFGASLTVDCGSSGQEYGAPAPVPDAGEHDSSTQGDSSND
jgi:hypothetical protein